MYIVSAHSPTWTDVEHTAIQLQVDFDGIGEVPFVASPTDVEAHGRELFTRAVAGDFGIVADYVPPTATWAGRQQQARAALDGSDLVALRCFKAGVEFPTAWVDYCEALRAIVRTDDGDPTQSLPPRPQYPEGT